MIRQILRIWSAILLLVHMRNTEINLRVLHIYWYILENQIFWHFFVNDPLSDHSNYWLNPSSSVKWKSWPKDYRKIEFCNILFFFFSYGRIRSSIQLKWRNNINNDYLFSCICKQFIMSSQIFPLGFKLSHQNQNRLKFVADTTS